MLKNIKLVGLLIVTGVLAGFSVYFYKNDMSEYIIICGTFICVCIVFIADDIIGRFTVIKSKNIADDKVHNMESNKEEVVEEDEPAEVIEKMISDRNEEEKTVTNMEPVHDNDKNDNGIDDQVEAEEASDDLEKMLEERKAEEAGTVIDNDETPVSEEPVVSAVETVETPEEDEPEVEVDAKDAPIIEEEKVEEKADVDEEII